MMYLKNKLIYFLAFSLALIFVSCGSQEKEISKSMEEIHAEEGLPVEITEVRQTGFSKTLSFYAPVSGIKEITERSMIADEILKVNASIGSYVEENQIIIEFPENNPTLQFDQAKEGYEIAKKTHERMKALLESGDISQSQYDQAETQYKVNKRNFEQLKQMLYIDAPISGTIISLPVRVGESTGMDTPLFTIAQLNQMIAKVNVSEKEIDLIKKGMKARAYYNDEIFNGVVTDIPLAMNKMTRSFPVEIQFSNPKRELISGVSVDIEIDIINKDSVITIPRNLVTEENDEYFVYLLNDSTAKKSYVTLGEESGVEVEILSGLKVGDELISCCKNMLDDGIKVKVVNKGE